MRHPRHNDPAPVVASMSAFVETNGAKRGRMAWAGHVGGQGRAARRWAGGADGTAGRNQPTLGDLLFFWGAPLLPSSHPRPCPVPV